MRKLYAFMITGSLLAALVFVAPLSTLAQGNGYGNDRNDNNGRDRDSGDRDRSENVTNKADNDDNDDNDDDRDNPNVSCLRAIGHLIAPGWIKHNGPLSVGVECHLPFGIGKKLGRDKNPDTNPDKTAPMISEISFAVTKTTAEVSWMTNEDADSVVFWDTDKDVDTSGDADNKISDGDLVKKHQLVIRDLSPETTYFAVVRSTDKAGNESSSSVVSFKTKPETSDTTAPIISSIVVTPSDSTIKVSWKTNENTTGRVYFSKGLPVISSSNDFINDPNGSSLSHTVTITGLSAGTSYYLVVESTDTAGNTAVAAAIKAATLADITAPVLSSIVVASGTSTATVTWKTNEPATSKVHYSTDESFGLIAPITKVVSNPALVMSHMMILTGLSPDSTYYFVVESTDASKNSTVSGKLKFVTKE